MVVREVASFAISAILAPMSEHVIIDGNNLLYAMHEHAPGPSIGRETLVRVIDRWARQGQDCVTLVFDGPVPRAGLAKQMLSSRIAVRFSAPAIADDVIVTMVHRAKTPTAIRVVSSDNAIKHEAKLRRCRHTYAADFVRELFASPPSPAPTKRAVSEKPSELPPEEVQEWLDIFGVDDSEPYNGYDAMNH